METEFKAFANVLLIWFTLSCLAAIVWSAAMLLFRGKRR